MMTLERKYNIGALYEQYAGRMPNTGLDKPSASKIDLKLDKTLLAGFVSDMPSIAKNYADVSKGDPKNFVRNGRFVDGESREIHRAMFETSPSVRFSVTKNFSRMHDDVVMDTGTYPAHPAGEESESVFFELYDNDTEIGGYRLDRGMETTNRNQWALNDRMVLDEYRDQGFGGALMIATESFLQSQADLLQSPQKLTANVGQPSVLLMLLNKDFTASSPEDQKRIDRVLAADPELELDYAVVNEEGTLTPEIFKDLYCFEKGTLPKTEVNALRINLEKNFKPKITQVGVTQKLILDSTQAALLGEKEVS